MKLSKFGSVINDTQTGALVYQAISDELKKSSLPIDIDLAGVITMATFCAKQIFGKLYLELGQAEFFGRLILRNASSDLRFIIRTGIDSALEDNKRR